jgi:hypothetical protein
MSDTHEPPSLRERKLFEKAGVWAVVGGAAALLLAMAVVFLHRPHTTQLTPGQAQPSSLAFLGLASS